LSLDTTFSFDHASLFESQLLPTLKPEPPFTIPSFFSVPSEERNIIVLHRYNFFTPAMVRVAFRGLREVCELDIPEDLTFAEVRFILESDYPTLVPNVLILYHGVLLHESITVGELGICPSDHVILLNAPGARAPPLSPSDVPAGLASLGFSREHCLGALRAAGGDVDRAAALLARRPSARPDVDPPGLESLIDLGFSREQSLGALRESGMCIVRPIAFSERRPSKRRTTKTPFNS
jgi:hypothetical protein